MKLSFTEWDTIRAALKCANQSAHTDRELAIKADDREAAKGHYRKAEVYAQLLQKIEGEPVS